MHVNNRDIGRDPAVAPTGKSTQSMLIYCQDDYLLVNRSRKERSSKRQRRWLFSFSMFVFLQGFVIHYSVVQTDYQTLRSVTLFFQLVFQICES